MMLGPSRLRSHVRVLVVAAVVALPTALAPACSTGDTSGGFTASGGEAASGGGRATGTHSTGSLGVGGGTGGGTGACKPATCSGTCLSSGVCCDDADVCGDQCCATGTVCLVDACVTPGKRCHTNSDCGSSSYCETALGDGGGGGSAGGSPDAGTGGGACLQPLPLPGRCLPKPPVCGADGGTPDGGCLADCEYHPPVAPMLDAVQRWQWGPTANQFPDTTDVWATPTIGRIYDANCDGKVDELDPPDVVFVSGNATNMDGTGECCQCTDRTPSACTTGVLRMLDGSTGLEIWSVDHIVYPTTGMPSVGFDGLAVAIGDVDGDGRMDILAVTGEGYVAMFDANGVLERVSDQPIPNSNDPTFGWGGGLAIADMDGDGFPEIAFGATVYTTTNGAITKLWSGSGGIGSDSVYDSLSTFVDLDGDGKMELLAGRTAYKIDGTTLWDRADLTDGFSAVGDFDKDGSPEAVLVTNGQLIVLDGATGATKFPALTLPGTGSGGPPTVADFDGDGYPEIGIAQANLYSMVKPNLTTGALEVVWSTPNHDLSSSVTGSSVFDFEGDGKAEVIYGDECFLWVFDGATGAVRFAASHSSFTGTEASLVADVDGQGHAEILMVSNSADPTYAGWKCLDQNGVPTVVNGVTWTPGPYDGNAYRGLALYSDAANSWVGTRTLWNEHTYHVSNVCDDRDTACDAPNVYGSIPKVEKRNWSLPWLNDFRQNVQDQGIFDAPDATVALAVACTTPVVAHVSVRNIGLSSLPAGVQVGVFKGMNGTFTTEVGTTQTTHVLFPGQTENIDVTLSAAAGDGDSYVAQILVDPQNPTFHECRDDNDTSDPPVKPSCVH